MGICKKWSALGHEMKVNENDNNNNNNNNVSTNCNFKSCDCIFINRLIFILQTYHKWCANIEIEGTDNNNISIVEIIDNLPYYSQIHLYNDYCHMLDFHSNFEEFWIHISQSF